MARDPFGWEATVVDDKYRVDEVVGKGGFAIVYRGYHLTLDEPVAIKCLQLPGSLDDEERQELLDSFRAEGKLLHRLSTTHAGIVQALDQGAATSPNGTWTPYLVLEWLEGQSLGEELDARARSGAPPLTLTEALQLLEPVAEALAAAHEQGVAHRDIKPDNLFLVCKDDTETLKVVDFGLAKVIKHSLTLSRALEATGTSLKAFTPQYGAPEQFDYTQHGSGPWTDVFALALVLVELVSGERALQGEDLIQLHLCALDRARRPTPRNRGVSVPRAVEEVMQQALAVNPKDRFATVGAFWAALQAAVDEHDTDGVPSETLVAPRVATGRTRSDEPAAHALTAVASGAGRPSAGERAEPSATLLNRDAPEADEPADGPTPPDKTPSDEPTQSPRWLPFAGIGAAALIGGYLAWTAAGPTPAPTTLDTTSGMAAGTSTTTVAPGDASSALASAASSGPAASTAPAPTTTGPSPSPSSKTTSSEPPAPPPEKCRQLCHINGSCALVADRCVVGTDAHCRASLSCGEFGGCVKVGQRCGPGSDADCQQSRVACGEQQRCRAVSGFCVK